VSLAACAHLRALPAMDSYLRCTSQPADAKTIDALFRQWSYRSRDRQRWPAAPCSTDRRNVVCRGTFCARAAAAVLQPFPGVCRKLTPQLRRASVASVIGRHQLGSITLRNFDLSKRASCHRCRSFWSEYPFFVQEHAIDRFGRGCDVHR